MRGVRRPYSRIRDPRILIYSLVGMGVLVVAVWVLVYLMLGGG